MRKLKLYLGFLIPLLITCASFMLLNIANSTVSAYEQALNKDYSVIIVSNKVLDLADLSSIKYANKLEVLSTDNMIKRLSTQLSANNIKALKSSLPHFYSLSFNRFMNQLQIEHAKDKLLNIAGINKVEVFSKTHTKVYHLLVLLKAFCFVAGCIIALLCLVLIIKQTRIWLNEHALRIYILELFGASFLGRCGFILKMVFISCILNYLLLLALFLNFSNFGFVKDFYSQIDAPIPSFNAPLELGIISLAAFIISFLAVSIVLKKASK